MDYEKKYNEAIKRAKQHCADYVVETIFPELKESEDERIRKGIIRNLEYLMDRAEGFVKVELQQRIAWLEKQKTSEEALQYLRENHSSSEMSDFQAAMNIAVAKAYDKGYNDGLEKQGEQKPVEPEFVWEDKLGERLKREKEMQKPAWSDEDEIHLAAAINIVANSGHTCTSDWLKSLKERYTWKPSDEQMYILNWVADILLNHDSVVEMEASKKHQSLYNDLKKLKGE